MASGLVELGLDVVLRHHVLADHAARFADVELMRPVAGVGELVLAQAPGRHDLVQRRRAPADRSRGSRGSPACSRRAPARCARASRSRRRDSRSCRRCSRWRRRRCCWCRSCRWESDRASSRRRAPRAASARYIGSMPCGLSGVAPAAAASRFSRSMRGQQAREQLEARRRRSRPASGTARGSSGAWVMQRRKL